ncbi:MAG TPA: UvrD-helicase domain-containing protein [Spirochaetota bacterium]|nr:UvrD-helicase domain-containing protein [Spirochaetota bacterium]HOD16331.1 UvrD-helicase domain-containing protein [Spirochaetota bacterium]HPG50708.1 UvrD-helicase domain-containing protein [Spirochaetota bacterium]HPN12132.1 UvrD-helicase domain-containing protein [Spirochaetota bacterium]
MTILENLNEHQLEAVTRTEGPLLILAGAGSGKTRVITHRIAYLAGEKRVPPTSIFAVTFTNKATEEMKNRIVRLIGPAGSSVFIKTFHAAAVYILRRYGERIGVHPGFSIYDTSDQASLIKEILKEMRLDPKKIRPESIASRISEIKDRAELIDGTDPALLMQKNLPFDFPEIYARYHEGLNKSNALDFNDLLIKTVALLREDQASLAALQRQWRYFMVDEYQDTNYAQYLIAKYLASASRNLCVVGDDDQSIYSWRGADIRNILNFEKDYADAVVVTLGTNYRSTDPILAAASSVIRNNVNRKDKELTAHRGDGESVVWCRANNEYGEAEYVINTLVSLKHRERFSNKDFAVFYRTNAQSRVFEDRLRKENIPYRVVGGMKFYERKEIKDAVAYLKFIANPADLVSLMRIINTPSRGIGAVAIDRIREAAANEGVTVWDVIRDGLMGGKQPKGLAGFRELIVRSREATASVPAPKLSSIVDDVLKGSGYIKSLEEEDSLESRSRLENLSEFMNSVYDYEAAFPESTLDAFLQDISLYTSEENPDDDPESRNNAVTLMTVHNAKGLEFPVVFLTGMEEDMFPHRLSSDTQEGIEEERRLCYVGITRAMERAYLTSADLRRTFNEVFHKEPSRFIFEIPQNLLEIQTHYESGYQSGPYRRSFVQEKKTYADSHYTREELAAAERADDEPADDAPADGPGESKFRVRESVMHPKYGVGRVLSIEGSGDNLKLTILFGSRIKTFLEKYTPLEKA